MIACAKCSGAGLGVWPQHAYPHAPDCPNLLAEIESRRQSRHHDVLCLVLKELVGQVSYAGRHVAESNPHASWAEVVSAAREVADLAYPPPKAEP